MKWLFVLVLVVLALCSAFGGFVAAADPEGRHMTMSLVCWAVAAVSAITAVAVGVLA